MLIATGIMAVGLVMVATIFPVAVKLTSLSAERSIAAVVADEAFAKVQLYGLRDFVNWPAAHINGFGTPDPDATYDFCDDFMFTVNSFDNAGADALPHTQDDVYFEYATPMWGWFEFLYPSTTISGQEDYKYHWSALCRRTGDKDVQVTVFATSRTFAGVNYYGYPYNPAITDYEPVDTAVWPVPVKVDVEYTYNPADVTLLRKLVILPNGAQTYDWDTMTGLTETVSTFFDEGCTIVNDRDGKIYRILEMKDLVGADNKRETLVLYEDWEPDPMVTVFPVTETVWVVPPGVGSDRYPCVGVFQKVIHFENIN